jgi:thiosulfate dehydrogenase (quinone) large subunit
LTRSKGDILINSTPQPNTERSPNNIPAIIFLPLRLFLGLIFFFAGLDKLTDSTFLDPSNPNYIGKQLQGYVDYNHSPISFLLTSVAIPNARLFGIMISLTELIVGVLVIVGLFTRVAALVGLLLNTTLWLTASWGQTPFYTGWDLPYMFGWLTLLLAGAGPFSLDQRLTARSSPTPLAVSEERRNFLVRGGAAIGAVLALAIGGGVALTGLLMRGNSDSGVSTSPGSSATPTAQPTSTNVAQLEPTGTPPAAPSDTPIPVAPTDTTAPLAPTNTAAPAAPTDAAAPPAATNPRPLQPAPTYTHHPQVAPTSTRPPQPAPSSTRPPQPAPTASTHPPQTPPTATTRPVPTATPPPASPPPTAITASFGGDINPGSTPAGGPTDTPIAAPTPLPAGGVVIGKVGDVPPGSGLRFTDPTTQNDAWVIHLTNGSFIGFSAICTHAGCAVNYSSPDKLFICPCHGSEYDPAQNGTVVKPPARRPLPKIQIRVDESSGNIYYVSD